TSDPPDSRRGISAEARVRSIPMSVAGDRNVKLGRFTFSSRSGPLAVAQPRRTGASRLRRRFWCSTTQLFKRPEENVLPGIPTQQPVDDAAARAHDLARHP